MNSIIRFLLGECRVELFGPEPQRTVNALTGAGVTFWRLQGMDAMHYRFSVFPKDKELMERIALQTNSSCTTIFQRGLPMEAKRLRARPFFILFMSIALVLTFLLQSFVWVVEVEGNETVQEELILRTLAEEGIAFGSWGYSIDSNETKLKLLNRIPQLSWLAVNRNGGKLSVLVTERDFSTTDRPPYEAGNIVAVREGTITDYAILEGMKLCNRGDTVQEGQILVSGYEDYGLFVRRVCAEGEIYAQTWHSAMVATPVIQMKKRYTGRSWEQVSLVLGRNRIKLLGNSSNLDTTCDKIVSVRVLSLPGYTFPLTLEHEVCREYELIPTEVFPLDAQARLEEAWQNQLLQSMVAGKIQETQISFQSGEKLYLLRAESTCNEMIGRLIPIFEPSEGETE